MTAEHSIKKQVFEGVYKEPGAVWSVGPKERLIEVIENELKPCNGIDLGCGEGRYSIYLASKGFNMMGVDYIEDAIKYAKRNAVANGENIDFRVMDLLGDLKELEGKTFDFALDWVVLHHIMPEQRDKYMENLLRIINKGGKFLSFSFDLSSPCFKGGNKRYRQGSTGVKIYYATKDEVVEYFKPYFRNIIEPKTIDWRDKQNLHKGNFLFMEKT